MTEATTKFETAKKGPLTARFLNGVTDGLLALVPVCDDDGRLSDLEVTLANPAAIEVLELGGDGPVGKRVRADQALGELTGFVDRLELVAETGRTINCLECLNQGEEPRWLRVAASPFDGGVALTVIDVTAVKDWGDAFPAAHCLGEAVDRLTEGFALFDGKGRILICNSRFKEIFSDSVELLRPGASFRDLIRNEAEHGNFPDAIGRIDEWLDERMVLYEQAGPPLEQEGKDGRWYRVAERNTGDGGVVSLWTDITGVKQAEERLREALSSTAGGFALWDGADQLVACNEEYRQAYPLITDEIVPGVTFEELTRLALERNQFILGDDQAPEDWLEARLAAHREPERHGYFEQNLTDGRWIQASERRTRDGGVVSLRIDITHLKKGELQARQEGEYYRRYMDEIFITRSRLEKQGAALVQLAEDLFHEKEKAETASLRKTQFLANLSHELRTPMNTILGFAEMLKLEMFGPLGSDRYVQYAKDIYESGNHLLDLINDVLDMSRIESGRQKLHREDVDVHDVAKDCLHLVYARAEKEGVVLVNNVPDSFEPVYVDRRSLKQCLLNLLTNGIKFTPRGGSVSISADLVEGWRVIRVTDTGVGISQEDLPKLANPFVRAQGQEDVEEVKGTGLGLALTRSLIEMHGGELQIESRVGEGTAVSLMLPK